MTVVVDTSVIIDVLHGDSRASEILMRSRQSDPLHASEIVRLEVLAGMRIQEEPATRALLEVFTWHPVDAKVAELAGELGRRWFPSSGGIDSADLAIAATTMLLGAQLLTRNVKHFPMFSGLAAPY